MSLFGSLFTGVSALSAQSQATSIISNNIANVNTIGFKRSESSFESLVTSESRASRYSPGTVKANRIQRVDQQGPLQQSISTTDVALSGNGFFAVKANGDNSSLDQWLYTRNGQFSEDAEGFLRNSAGFYLYGWPLDSDGNRPSAEGDLSSLVPVDVAFLGGLTRETTTAELAINIDADEIDYNLDIIGGSYPIGDTQEAHFERGLRVYDTLGSSQDLNFEFRKIVGPMAHATSTVSSLELDQSLVDATVFPGIAAGETFSIGDGTAAGTETFIVGAAAVGTQIRIDTVGDFISALTSSTYGNGGTGTNKLFDADLDDNGRLLIRTVDPSDDLVMDDAGNGVLFGGAGFDFPDTGVAGSETYSPTAWDVANNQVDPNVYADNDETVAEDARVFPDLNTSNLNTEGWWEVTIRHPDGSVLNQGLLNFATDGSLNALADGNGKKDININNIDWNNGSDITQSISVDIERLSQFAGNYNVVYSDQNGAELGLRTGVEIDEDGFVVARFSNGATSKLYQLPIITFANPNGLQEISGTAYSETEESGEENLRVAGEGGAGNVESSVLENSNVDLADEFSRLIISQRAYSAGTRVISTVDQMTQDLLNLR
jgi:flagellar hook protein FlgE